MAANEPGQPPVGSSAWTIDLPVPAVALTVPTVGLMEALVPLELVHDKTDICPAVMVVGLATKDEIAGFSGAGLTVTVVVRVAGVVPAAALTAFAREEDRQAAFRAGFQLHLTKPVEAASLVAAVATLGKWNHHSAKDVMRA